MDDELRRRIAKLGRLVAEARQLSEVADHYHDQLLAYRPFVEAGVAAEHKPLRQLVRSVTAAYDLALPETGGKLYRIADASLWHGVMGDLLGPMAFVVYFDDQHRGVVSFGLISDPNTHHARFSLPEGSRDPDQEIPALRVAGVSAGRRGQA